MNFTYTHYYGSFECSFNGTSLTAEGVLHKEYKKFTFEVGNACRLKFKHKRAEGIIQSFTKKFVVIAVEDSIKKVTFEDFISDNIWLNTCIRLEKNGVGPYQCKEVSEEFKAWREKICKAHTERRDNGERGEHQPTPDQDSHLEDYAHHIRKMTFGFKDYNQMFNWFSLEEVQFMVKEGFEIKHCQEGRDFAETIGAYHQVAMIKTKEAYQEIINSPSRYY